MSQNRREFLTTAVGAAAATAAGVPLGGERASHAPGVGGADPRSGPAVDLDTLPGLLAGADAGDAALWDVVRAQFMIPDDRLFMNPATLGPQPRAVVDAVIDHTRRTAETYPPRTDWDALKGRVGRLLNADPAGLVFPRNTTEAMNFVAQGLELKPGDEVLTTDHEHIGGLCCWELLAARRGVSLRQLPLPVPATSKAELVDLFRDAVTDRTRVISISHVTFTNGTTMPVPEIVALCRAHGLICVVDGAHPPGMMRVDMEALGPPDFYASSPHKWLGAPQGTGLLWMADEWRTRLWPTEASGGWDDRSLGAHRFNHLGTMDGSRLAGLDAAVRFHDAVGTDRVEARTRALRRRLRDALESLPGITIATPAGDTLSAGVVSFRLDGVESLELQRRLARAAKVRTRVVAEYGYGWMRLSPHIYNTEGEVDRVVEVIRAVR
ncbi:MAG: aminotransferase class V-fold PLP-dependent enzyme [Longimicrobiales bacterium]